MHDPRHPGAVDQPGARFSLRNGTNNHPRDRVTSGGTGPWTATGAAASRGPRSMNPTQPITRVDRMHPCLALWAKLPVSTSWGRAADTDADRCGGSVLDGRPRAHSVRYHAATADQRATELVRLGPHAAPAAAAILLAISVSMTSATSAAGAVHRGILSERLVLSHETMHPCLARCPDAWQTRLDPAPWNALRLGSRRRAKRLAC